MKYHGPSGEFSSNWPDDTMIGDIAVRSGVRYALAGVQDGAVHYRESSGA